MAGLINPLAFKKLLTSKDDLNSIANGIYSASNTDNPVNAPSAYNFTLIQISHLATGDRYQVIFDGNTSDILYRKRFGGAWNNWMKIAFSN